MEEERMDALPTDEGTISAQLLMAPEATAVTRAIAISAKTAAAKRALDTAIASAEKTDWGVSIRTYQPL